MSCCGTRLLPELINVNIETINNIFRINITNIPFPFRFSLQLGGIVVYFLQYFGITLPYFVRMLMRAY